MQPFRTSVRRARELWRGHGAISSPAGCGDAAACPGAAPAEPVRAAMRALAGELAPGQHARLRYAIDVSRDVTGLWHLRVTLMQALASSLGESAARARIVRLDSLFLQVWPEAPVIRA
jgi:hypothetical protein